MSTRTIIITGGTRGIGYGLAKEFALRGHNVYITGRSENTVQGAVKTLKAETQSDTIIGMACDVADLDAMQRLWSEASAAFGTIDIWINNAGIANVMNNFENIEKSEYDSVVQSNIIGTLNGCKVALLRMKQQGHGQIYNFEGFGSDNRTHNGLSVYGMTKRAITYFTSALIKENKDSPVNVGYMSPGIVITDMVTQEAEHMPPDRWSATKRLYNILGDKVQPVTEWLALAVLGDVGQHGSALRYLTPMKAAGRFFQAFVLRKKRDLFADL